MTLREIRASWVLALHNTHGPKRIELLRHIHKLTVHIRWEEQRTFFKHGAWNLSRRVANRKLRIIGPELPNAEVRMIDQWAIDASQPTPSGMFCFIPVQGDITRDDCEFVTGLAVISTSPPGKLVAIFHQRGQAAAEQWFEIHKPELERLKLL